MSNKTLTINTDGGARGNPGPSAWAFVVRKSCTSGMKADQLMHEEKGYIGIATNNQAEYFAVKKAFEWLLQNTLEELEEVHFILDSELVVRQLTGVYKIKDQHLQKLAQEIKNIQKELNLNVTFTSVPRSQNSEADFLVNEALDENV